MADELQDFHYMSVLRGLEKSAVALKQNTQSSDRKRAYRISKNVFGNLLAAFMAKDPEQTIGVALKSDREEQELAEREMSEKIRQLTEGRIATSKTNPTAGDWPPIIPATRIVERFAALTIGLHSENPHGVFAGPLRDAFRAAVIPAIAWGLMIRLLPYPDSTRREIQLALVKRFRGTPKPYETVVKLSGQPERKLEIDYLRMVEAWFLLVEKETFCQLPAEAIKGLREDLAGLMAKDFSDLDTELWNQLGTQYLAVLDGSERARIVAQAQSAEPQGEPTAAAFIRSRLALFDAAMLPEYQSFRLQLEPAITEDLEVFKHRFKAYDDADRQPSIAGQEACAAAFWLARYAFARHSGETFTAARRASGRALLLLMRAAEKFKLAEEQVLLCVRFAAGLATNPRYARSMFVLDSQKQLVDLYAKLPGARQALVEHFRGRIAWQEWQSDQQDADRRAALKHFQAALRLHRDGSKGFDAEAPIHFFPELGVLMEDSAKRLKGETRTLRAIDFITQRNYGIYFDIDTERKRIYAGMDDFKRYRQSKSEHEVVRRKAQADAEEQENEWAKSLEEPDTQEGQHSLEGMHGYIIRKSA